MLSPDEVRGSVEPETQPDLDEVAGAPRVGVLPSGSRSVLSNGLQLPLTALRASIESLGEALRQNDGGIWLEGAIGEIDRLGRNVRALLEYASAPQPRPLICTVEEILLSARRALPQEQRSRIVIARAEGCGGNERLEIDGPLLSVALRRLCENALEAGSEIVVLIARPREQSSTFCVINDGPSFDYDWARSAFETSKTDHLGLGLPLTCRDVSLLEGRIDVGRGAAGAWISVTVPNRPSTSVSEDRQR